MKLLLGFIVTTCILGANACSPDEPVITSFNDTWQLLATHPRGLAVYAMPQGNQTAILQLGNGTDYPVHRLRAFRDELFAVVKQPASIVVFSRFTIQPTDTIDLGTNIVQDIAFANATTAYATVPTQNKILVLDITTKKIASEISCSGTPTGITCVGNQIAVACQESNQLAILDSRTNTETTRISVNRAPTFVEADLVTGTIVCVSLGNGKIDKVVSSVPIISMINSNTATLTREVELSTKFSEAPGLLPTAVVVNASNLSYVSAQNGLSRLSTGRSGKAQLTQFSALSFVAYDAARAELIQVLSNGKQVSILDETGVTVKNSIILQDSTTQILGLAP